MSLRTGIIYINKKGDSPDGGASFMDTPYWGSGSRALALEDLLVEGRLNE